MGDAGGDGSGAGAAYTEDPEAPFGLTGKAEPDERSELWIHQAI